MQLNHFEHILESKVKQTNMKNDNNRTTNAHKASTITSVCDSVSNLHRNIWQHRAT